MFDHLIAPCRALSRTFLRNSTRQKAVAMLGDAFYDVPLGTPMKLTVAEARSLTRDAAAEMREQFEAVKGRVLSRAEHAALAERVDPLWRVIAAANWDVAGERNESRILVAADIVTNIVMMLGMPVSEAAEEIQTQVRQPNSPLMAGPLPLIMESATIAPHHIVEAIERITR